MAKKKSLIDQLTDINIMADPGLSFADYWPKKKKSKKLTADEPFDIGV